MDKQDLSPLQKRWHKRSRILWRLKGFGGFQLEDGILTTREQNLLYEALVCIDSIIKSSVESSIELGFKAKKRDTWGRIVKD